MSEILRDIRAKYERKNPIKIIGDIEQNYPDRKVNVISTGKYNGIQVKYWIFEYLSKRFQNKVSRFIEKLNEEIKCGGGHIHYDVHGHRSGEKETVIELANINVPIDDLIYCATGVESLLNKEHKNTLAR